MKYLGNPQSGSQANTTASHNRAGQYLRNRRVPVVPTRTPKQSVLRSRFASASAAWQTLTTALQNAWTSFAHGYPVVDALGQSIVLTGHQYFVGVSTSLLNAGQTIITSVPSNTTVNPVAPVDLYVDNAGVTILTFTAPAAGDFVLAAASPVVSAGRAFNKLFSQFGVDSLALGVVDMSDAFVAQYGPAPTGKQVFAKATAVNSSGMSTPGTIVRSLSVIGGTIPAPVETSAAPGTVTSTYTGTSPADVVTYTGPSITGPWTPVALDVAASSPHTVSGLPSGLYGTARIRVGGLWSLLGTGILIT